MSSFTRVGASIWNWPPFIELVYENGDPHYPARNLWWALYTSPQAKTGLPGLFMGSLATMADHARMPFRDAQVALQALIDAKMVEFDAKWSVLRMTKLPDEGEWPQTPSILETWWKRFNNVPACSVRDAHVSLLRWLMDKGAKSATKNKSKRPSDLHEEIWSTTFGTILVPPSHRTGVNVLPSADTSTPVQPSLFPPKALSDLPPTIKEESPTLSSSGRQSPRQSPGLSGGVSGEGEGEGEGSFLSSSGSACPTAPEPPVDRDRDDRPRLALVPGPQPYAWVLDQLASASNGRYHPAVREGLHAALCSTMREFSAAHVGPEQIAVVASWRGLVTEISSIGGDPRSRLSVWVAGEGNVLAALKAATEHEREAREASAHLAELKKQLGY